MSRKLLSVALLVILTLSLNACIGRRGEVELPTPAIVVDAPSPTTPPTGDPATDAPATLPPATAAPTDGPTLAPPTAPPTTATLPPATATLLPATATLLPATTIPPTAAPDQGPPPGGSARIVFGPGATSATVRSTLAAGGDTDTWILRAAAGQTITVQTLATTPGALVVRLGDMSGGVLSTNPDTIAVSATVPADGDYQISFSTASSAPQVGYTAQVTIPAGGGTTTPTRIQFAPGTSVAQLNDALAAGGDLNRYVLRVDAGQTISVGVFASPPAVTAIAIRDGAGTQITSGTDMSGVSGVAPAAGDYFIDVSNAAGAPAVSYLLTVSVPPLPGDAPTRIEFGPGQTSATVNGLVRAGLNNRYVLRGGAGQTLVTTLTGHPVNTVEINVADANGAVLNLSTDPSTMVTTLPAAGDYIITLGSNSPTDVTYVLKIGIPPDPPPGPTRIQFAPGATSATVNGALDFGGDVDNWVVRAAAGQIMNLGISANNSGWMNLFIYDPSGKIVNYGTDSTGVAAPLPAAGDYTIVVSSIQAAPPVQYGMTVTIVDDTRPQQPTRIEFGPGQTSAGLVGQVSATTPVEYVIRMGAGQTLLTHLDDDPRANVEIAVLDTAATLLNFGRSPTQLGTRIPAAGDYLIRLFTTSGTAVNYNLDVIAPPLPGSDGTRLIIPVGSTTTTASGNLGFGGDSDTWVLGGAAGQVLDLYVSSDQPGWIRVYVYNGANDIIALGADMNTISAPLNATQDYRVVVISDAAAGPVNYVLEVEIR